MAIQKHVFNVNGNSMAYIAREFKFCANGVAFWTCPSLFSVKTQNDDLFEGDGQSERDLFCCELGKRSL